MESKKIVGDFGEVLVSFCLSSLLDKEKIPIYQVGAGNYTYDIVIPSKSTIFKKPVFISVKTRELKTLETFKWICPPTLESIENDKIYANSIGYDFWIAIVIWDNSSDYSFNIYMLKSEMLNKDDFGKKDEIKVKNFIEKSKKFGLLFNSEKMKSETSWRNFN